VKFWQVTVSVRPENSERIASALFDWGSTGLIESDEKLIAYFPDSADIESLRRDLPRDIAAAAAPWPDARLEIEAVAERDWNAEWKNHWAPVSICPDLIISPSWIEVPPRPGLSVVVIDPEMSFGTGTHATTRLCLRLLKENMNRGEAVLDVGTGSGILAITALRMGAARAVALDLDPVSIRCAKKNALRNRVGGRLLLFAGPLSALRLSRFDTMLINIDRAAILKILPLAAEMLDYGDRIILSGILSDEEDELRAALAGTGFKVLSTSTMDEWIAFVILKGS